MWYTTSTPPRSPNQRALLNNKPDQFSKYVRFVVRLAFINSSFPAFSVEHLAISDWQFFDKLVFVTLVFQKSIFAKTNLPKHDLHSTRSGFLLRRVPWGLHHIISSSSIKLGTHFREIRVLTTSSCLSRGRDGQNAPRPGHRNGGTQTLPPLASSCTRFPDVL